MDLTKRETQILQHFANGDSTREVAKRLGISYFTVKQHRVRIRHRLGAKTFAQAIAIALDEDIIEGTDAWTT